MMMASFYKLRKINIYTFKPLTKALEMVWNLVSKQINSKQNTYSNPTTHGSYSVKIMTPIFFQTSV